MAKRSSQADKAFQQVCEFLEVPAMGRDRLLIVNSAMLREILDALPEGSLAKVLKRELVRPIPSADVSFSTWLKAARAQTGLPLRQFADALRAKGVKVWGSDIGNLECDNRTSHYRPQRIAKIRNAVIEVLKDLEQSPPPS